MKLPVVLFLYTSATLHLAAAVSSRIDVFTQTPAYPVLGDTVVVWCIGTGNGQLWYVNHMLPHKLDPISYTINHYGNTNKDFWNITSLTFKATLDKSNIRIQCCLQGDSGNDCTDNITIILAGPPLPPATMLEDLYEGTVLRLSWTEPFSPPPYPVTSYHVVVYNNTISTDNVLVNVSINSTQHHYDFIKTNNTAACPVLIFAASATSDIGTSNVSTVVGTFPMVTDVNDLNISYEVVLEDGVTTQLTVWFQEPLICPLQERASYMLDILDGNGNVVASSGLLEARGGSDGRVVSTFTGLNCNLKVSIKLTFVHSSLSGTTQIATEEGIKLSTLQLPHTSDYPVDEDTSTSLNSTTVIIITVVSVGVSVVVVMIIIFIAITCVVKKGRHQVVSVVRVFNPAEIPRQEFNFQNPSNDKNKVHQSLPTMKANPIYDGPIYDTPGGESPMKLAPSNKNFPPLPQLRYSSTSTGSDTYTKIKHTYIKRPSISQTPAVLPEVCEAKV